MSAVPPFRAEDAIAFALADIEDHYDREAFLQAWQEGRWDALREEWPEAYTKYAVHRSNEEVNSLLPPRLQALVRAAIDLCQARGRDPYVECLRDAGREWTEAANEVGHGMV